MFTCSDINDKAFRISQKITICLATNIQWYSTNLILTISNWPIWGQKIWICFCVLATCCRRVFNCHVEVLVEWLHWLVILFGWMNRNNDDDSGITVFNLCNGFTRNLPIDINSFTNHFVANQLSTNEKKSFHLLSLTSVLCHSSTQPYVA